MNFTGPIPYKNSSQNHYLLRTVERLARFPHAETFNNCDTNTTIGYLESYCNLHGRPRSMGFDQKQAFKAKQFDIFPKNENIKLILAPAGAHRGTDMVERLLRSIKRRLVVLDSDPYWSNNLTMEENWKKDGDSEDDPPSPPTSTHEPARSPSQPEPTNTLKKQSNRNATKASNVLERRSPTGALQKETQRKQVTYWKEALQLVPCKEAHQLAYWKEAHQLVPCNRNATKASNVLERSSPTGALQ